MSTAAIDDGVLYISSLSGFLHALDPQTGEEFWTYDAFAAVWGSPYVVDGKVFLGDEDGDVVVLRAGTEMEVLGEYNLGAAVYCTRVARDGVLYILTRNRIWFRIEHGRCDDPRRRALHPDAQSHLGFSGGREKRPVLTEIPQ